MNSGSQKAEALATFRKAIAMLPRDVRIRLQFVKYLMGQGHPAEAIPVLREALALDTSSAEIHKLMAACLLSATELPEAAVRAAAAEEHLRKSVALDPNNAAACEMLGFRLQSIGQFDEARPLLERAMELQPRQGTGYCGFANGRRLTQDDAPFIARIEEVLRTGGLQGKELSYLHYALGKARNDFGRYEEAMRHYDEANRIAYEALFGAKLFDRQKFVAAFAYTKKMFSREMLAQAQPVVLAGPRPIFVLGVMRSGTTLVEQIVSSHSDVAGGGELDFWGRQGNAALRQSGDSLSMETVQALGGQYSETLRNLAAGLPWVTDKMPQNYQSMGLIHLACRDAPIVYVKRNALDTCLSIWTTPYEDSPDFLHDKENIMFMYEQHLDLMEHWRQVLPPGRFLEVQYEQLVANREAETRRILEYCGLPWDERCLYPEQNERTVLTSSFWQVRQPVYAGSVSRWKRYEPWLGEFSRLIPQA